MTQRNRDNLRWHRREDPRTYGQLQSGQIVEIVSDAARKLTNRFHFLRLMRRLLRRGQTLLIRQRRPKHPK